MVNISVYRDEMLDQVSELFESQYKIDREKFKKYFIKFYNSPYQEKDAIKVVAIDGHKICGFQSYFRWDYIIGQKKFKSIQSGGSIVDQSYRGQGIFRQLLNFADEIALHNKIDFAVGFPVPQSFSSFIKLGWNNIGNIDCYIGMPNPFKFKNLNNIDPKTAWEMISRISKNNMQYTHNKSYDFFEWREGWRESMGETSQYFHYKTKQEECVIEYKKINRYFIKIAYIGQIYVIKDYKNTAYNALTNMMNRLKNINIFMTHLNTESSDLNSSIIKERFHRVPGKNIKFIIKKYREIPSLDLKFENWVLNPTNFDTW